MQPIFSFLGCGHNYIHGVGVFWNLVVCTLTVFIYQLFASELLVSLVPDSLVVRRESGQISNCILRFVLSLPRNPWHVNWLYLQLETSCGFPPSVLESLARARLLNSSLNLQRDQLDA